MFRDSAVQNLKEFFGRFRQLSVGSDEQLDAVVQQAEALLGDTVPQELRDQTGARQWISQGLAEVRQALDPLLVDRPRRKILRTPR